MARRPHDVDLWFPEMHKLVAAGFSHREAADRVVRSLGRRMPGATRAAKVERLRKAYPDYKRGLEGVERLAGKPFAESYNAAVAQLAALLLKNKNPRGTE